MTTPEESRNGLDATRAFNVGQSNAGKDSDKKPAGNVSTGEDFQTTVGADIGNFFRVLLAFLSGMWNGDLADFHLLSDVYFPDMPEEGTSPKPKTEQQQHLQRGVDEMRRVERDPNHPQREMPIAEVARHYTQGLPPNATFEQIVEIFLPFEGGLNLNEPRGAKANYGINSEAHPEIKDVAKLTRAEAIQIYRKDYWDAIKWQINEHIGKDQLSAAVKLIAFDASANSGIAFANKILHESYKQAKGNVETMPAIMLEMRRDKYAQLIRDNPDEYARYKSGWDHRLKGLEESSKRFDMRTPTDVLHSTPPEELQKQSSGGDSGGFAPAIEDKPVTHTFPAAAAIPSTGPQSR